MSAETISRAVLQFSATSTYPEAEDVITTELNPALLSTILESIRKERDALKQEVRTLSKATGPNVEVWIDQAKRLQDDILTSRDMARQIVKEHEAGHKVKENIKDAESKIGLLEREVKFESTLEEALLQIKHANDQLLSTQESIVHNNMEQAFERLSTAKTSVGKLTNLHDTRCLALLRERGRQMQNSLEESLSLRWSSTITVDIKSHELRFCKNEDAASLATIVEIAQELGILESLVLKLCRNLERALLKPLLSLSPGKQCYRAEVNGSSIRLHAQQDELTPGALLASLERILEFLSTFLPTAVQTLLSEKLMPALLTRLEEDWLEPLIPVQISEVQSFEETITTIANFADRIEVFGWTHLQPLRDWLDNIPKAWLTKRRETLLSDIRNLVFQGLNQTKTVERVESQMITKADAVAAQVHGGEDDWDNAWDEDQEKHTAAPNEQLASEEDDDGSAWDVDDTDNAKKDNQDTTEDAWGWGDEEHSVRQKEAATPVHVPASQTPSRREMTFRETYTITVIPDHILEAVQNIIADAQALATDEFASTALAPAVVGLYALPTLALALYRATAQTAYAKLGTGNMLIYNDATRLSERLRAWQASQPAASRLRLDNDAKALDMFAKRAYSTEMESQRTVLRDLLDGAQGFSNATSSPFREECESAVEQTADRLQDVHREWKSVLGHNALLQSLGQLLSGVTGKMIADIEDLVDIGEEDSRQLKLLCERLSIIKALFAQPQPDGELRDMTFVYCPNWLKFQYLAVILESSLADIRYMWNDGELSLEFSSEEVVELIKALFAESDHRKKLIAELRRQSRR